MLADPEALRQISSTIEGLARRRAEAVTVAGAAAEVRWSGPRRDRFVIDTVARLAGDGQAAVDALEALASELRALAADVEERLALLRRIEERVRAELDRLATSLSSVLRTLRDGLGAAAAIVGAAFDRIAALEQSLLRIALVRAALPPSGDPRWEAFSAALDRGRLAGP